MQRPQPEQPLDLSLLENSSSKLFEGWFQLWFRFPKVNF